MVERFQNYIGGKFVDAGDGRTFDSLDPYAGEAWEQLSFCLNYAILAPSSHNSQPWRLMTGGQRLLMWHPRRGWEDHASRVGVTQPRGFG